MRPGPTTAGGAAECEPPAQPDLVMDHESPNARKPPSSTGEPDSTSFFGRGGGWVVGQSILMGAVVLSGAFWGGQWHSWTAFGAGCLLFVAGGTVGVAGVVHLGRARTAFPRPLANRQLVTSGIYARIRHPLYTSVLCASFGWALIGASWPALGVAVALTLFLDAKARHEERWLRQTYPDYVVYAQRVRRMLPWVY